MEVRGQISYHSWRPQILLPSRSKLTFAHTRLVSHSVTTNWGEWSHPANQHTPQGCVQTSPHSPRRLCSSAPYLGLSLRGSSAQSPHPHVQVQNCCPDGQCSLWYGCQGDQVRGTCWRHRTRLSLLQVSWKYSVDSKGFRTWRWVPGDYGDHSEGCNLPDMRSLACASPRMLNLRIPGP